MYDSFLTNATVEPFNWTTTRGSGLMKELNLPVYLEPDVAEFIQRHSSEKNTDIQTIVNQWLRKDIEVLKLIM